MKIYPTYFSSGAYGDNPARHISCLHEAYSLVSEKGVMQVNSKAMI